MTCTMGKGLYQGSYQRVEVDAEAGEARITGGPPVASKRRRSRGCARPPAGPPGPPLPCGCRCRRVRSGPAGWAARWRVLSHLPLHEQTLFVSAWTAWSTALEMRPRERCAGRRDRAGYCCSSPVLAADRVIGRSADAHVYAFDAATGAERWRFATKDRCYASARGGAGDRRDASGDGAVYGLDVATGRSAGASSCRPGRSAFAQSHAATDGERFFIGAWDPGTCTDWTWRPGGSCALCPPPPTSFYYSAAIGAPAVTAGGSTCLNDNTLHALDHRTGQPV